MKKIVLLFSMMLLMAATMFGQQNYIRSSKVYLVEGTPTFTPNKYRGSVIAIDTADVYKMYIYNYATAAWSNDINFEDLSVAGDLYVDELVEFDSTTTLNGALLIYGSLFSSETLLNTVDDTLTNAGTVFISTYTTTGAHEINLGTDATLDGRIIFIQDGDGNAGTNNITLTGIQSVTINGGANYVMDADHESVILYAVGTDWRILGAYLE